MSELLKISGLSLWAHAAFGLNNIIDGVDISVDRGEIHGLIGESGCGKTMLAKTVLDLHDRERTLVRGSIEYNGRELFDMPKRERRAVCGKEIGYITQDPLTALNPLYRVSEQLAEMLRYHKGLDKRAALEEAKTRLESVGISRDMSGRYPHQFSGGQLQRICFAAAVCCEPGLVIADEPTTALDVTTQAQILELLRGLKRSGTSVLIITHDFGVVAELCDSVSVMEKGRIVEEGTMRELLTAPKADCTRRLMESARRKEDYCE